MNSKAKGEISEAKIIARLIELGKSVSIPFGNNQRYDLIVDLDGQLIRVQCKTARINDGVLIFNCSSTNGFTSKKRSYIGEIDAFAVYSPDLDKVYWIPIDRATSTSMYLRIAPPKINQTKFINYAAEFELK